MTIADLTNASVNIPHSLNKWSWKSVAGMLETDIDNHIPPEAKEPRRKYPSILSQLIISSSPLLMMAPAPIDNSKWTTVSGGVSSVEFSE